MDLQTFILVEVNNEHDLPPVGEKVIAMFDRFVNYLVYEPAEKERWLRGGLKWFKKQKQE